MSLTPVCVGQICKTEEFGRWFGTCYSLVSFAYVVFSCPSVPPLSTLELAVGGPESAEDINYLRNEDL